MNHRSTGTTQTERLAPKRQASDVSIVNNSQTDFLNFVQDFAGLLHYWNNQGNIEGNWDPFFQSDISFILADISRYDVGTLRRQSRQLKKSFFATHHRNQQEQYIISLYKLLLQSGQSLGHWYKKILAASNVDAAISNAFLDITQSNLNASLTQLVPIFDNLSSVFDNSPNTIAQQNIAYQTAVVSSLLAPLNPKAIAQPAYPGNGFPSSLLSFWQCYDQIFVSILTSITQILQSIPSFINTTLGVPNHSPQISLILAFYEMLQPARDQLNSIASRHHQFYLQQILQQKPQSYTPDQTFVTFQSAKTTTDLFLPKGTKLLAGTSAAGNPIIYQTQRDLSVNHATPSSFKTIYNGTVNSDPKLAVKGNILAAPVANSGNGQGSKLTGSPASWPTFGQPIPGAPTQTDGNIANLGFAISSPSLFYSDGNRRIRFTILTAPQDITALSNAIKKLQWPTLAPPSQLSQSATNSSKQKQSSQQIAQLQKALQQQQTSIGTSQHATTDSKPKTPQQATPQKSKRNLASLLKALLPKPNTAPSTQTPSTQTPSTQTPSTPDTKGAKGPKKTTKKQPTETPEEQLQKAQKALAKASASINEAEIHFRDNLQSCAITIAQISNRTPVPLSEWLDATIELIDFKTKYHLLNQYHQTQINHNLENKQLPNHKTPTLLGQVLGKPKQLEHNLANILSQKKAALDNLGSTLGKDAVSAISSSLDDKSKTLGNVIQKMISAKPSKALGHSSQILKSLKSIGSDIHPDAKIKQAAASTTALKNLTDPDHAQQIKGIGQLFDSALQQSHTATSSIFSLQWLIQVEDIIHKAEKQLITAANKSILVIPSPDIALKFKKIEKHNTVAYQAHQSSSDSKTNLLKNLHKHLSGVSKVETNTTPHPSGQQTEGIEADIKKGIHSLNLAHQGYKYLGYVWQDLSKNLTSHNAELSDAANFLKQHDISLQSNKITGFLGNLFPHPEQDASKGQKKKISQLTDQTNSLQQKIQQATNNLQDQATQIEHQTATTNKQFESHQKSLSDSAHKATQIIQLTKTTNQHLQPLANQLQKSAPQQQATTHADSELEKTISQLAKRLQCWQPAPNSKKPKKIAPKTRPSTLSTYHKLNEHFENILNALLQLLPHLENKSTTPQKQQIQQITGHIHTLQNKIQSIDNKLTSSPPITPSSTPQIQTLQKTASQNLTSLAKQLQALPTQQAPALTQAVTQLEHSLAGSISNSSASPAGEKSPSSQKNQPANIHPSKYHKLNGHFDSILNFNLKLLDHLKGKADETQIGQINQLTEKIKTLQTKIQSINTQASKQNSATGQKSSPKNSLINDIEKIPFIQHLKQTVEKDLTPLAAKLQPTFNLAETTIPKTLDELKQHLEKLQKPTSTPQTSPHSQKEEAPSLPVKTTSDTHETQDIHPSQYKDINTRFEDILTFLLGFLANLKKEANAKQTAQINQLTTHIQTLQTQIQQIDTKLDNLTFSNNTPDPQPVQDLQSLITKYLTPLSLQSTLPNATTANTLTKFEQQFTEWHTQHPFAPATQATKKPTPQPQLPEEPNWQSIHAVINNAFTIDYSGSKGWETTSDHNTSPLYIIPEAHSTSLAPTHTGFQIDITLPPTAQPPAAWTAKACGGDYQPDQPVFRASLNQNITIPFKNKHTQSINPYPLLSPLTFQDILIWGDVSQSSNFSAQNQFSTLKPAKPFALFGDQPIQGSEFYLGNNESLRKNLDYLISDITWYDLPQSQVGFAQMYNLYNRFGKPGTCYTNGAFQWSVDLLQQQKWVPLQAQKLQPFSRQTPSHSDSKTKQTTPVFEWNQVPFIELLPGTKPYISFTPKTTPPAPDIPQPASPAQPIPTITKPTLPPLPQMSPLNVGPLLPNTLLIFEPEHLQPQSNTPAPTAFSTKTLWNKDTTDGFLRFTLTQPPEAFGAQQYPDIMAAVTNANVTRMVDFVSFRALSPTEQDTLITAWTTSPTPKSTPSSTDKTKPTKETHHNILGTIVGDLGKVIKGIAVVGIDLAEKAPDPLVRFAAKAASHAEEILTFEKDHGFQTAASTDPSKIFAPIKPPPPAWTPKVKGISMSYGNYEKLTTQSDDPSHIQFYQIHPFGLSQPLKSATPQKSVELLPKYDSEGYLYIGLENINPPQTTTLLFTLDEATGNRRLPVPQPNWSFLSPEGWQDIPGTQLRDGTGGFIRSGIVSLTLLKPGDTTSDLFLSSPPLYWLRVAVPVNVQSACQTIDVSPQAVTAIYSSGADTSTHFNNPLPAKSLTKTVPPVPGLLKVNQPTPSFGGIPPETDSQFSARVSERLRHKDRAITAWDYENLILQQFPQIRACRTLNHTSIQQGAAPGTVTTLIFPEITTSKKPLSPLVDRSTLVDISDYLTSRCDPTLQLSVVNPDYLFAKITAAITLQPGKDPGHYLQILNQSLIQELAPWSIPASTVNPFSSSYTYDSILQYILTQPYIETVDQLQIALVPTQTSTAKGIIQPQGTHPITAPNAWTLLSSISQHTLTISTGKPAQLNSKPPTKSSQAKKHSPKSRHITMPPTSGNTLFLGGKD